MRDQKKTLHDYFIQFDNLGMLTHLCIVEQAVKLFL